jgi:hypothetical protein
LAKVVRKKGDIDLNELKIKLGQLDDLKLTIGWFESARYDSGTPVAGVAAVQEFGAPSKSIPPRPFLRPTVAENKEKWINFLAGQYEKVLEGETTNKQALEKLGLVIVGQIKKAISTLQEPPLSLVTLALRKHKLAGTPIGGKFVGQVAAAIAAGETGPGELGDSSGINPKPLVFTSFMLTSLTHEVAKK